MTHAFSIQDLPLSARLSIWRGDHLHLILVTKQADGSDVSWAGYTSNLVKPAGFPGTVALNPAAIGAPGAGEITLDIDTVSVSSDVRGNWAVEVTQAGSQTTLFGGLLTCDKKNPTRLRMQSGCGLDIDSQCKEPIVIYVPAQGIPGPAGAHEIDANCLAGDAVEDNVYITGPAVAGLVQVAKVDIDDGAKMPAVGVILSKSTATTCKVRMQGEYDMAADTFTPGSVVYVYSDGTPSTLPPTRPVAGTRFIQPIGIASTRRKMMLALSGVFYEVGPT